MDAKSECYVVRLNSDSKYILSGHQDRTIRLFNTQTAQQISTFEGAHNRAVLDISIFPENNFFLSCGQDKTFFLWETLKGFQVRKFEGHAQQVNSVSHNEDATVCASGSLDSTVALWDLKSRSSTRPIQRLTEFRDSVTQVKIKGTQIVASSLDGYVRVYDVRMGCLSEIKVGQPINSFDVKDTFVGCSCLDSTSRIVDMSDGQIVAEYSGSHMSTKYHSSL
jgi:mitogen-activated protein kinase organizer 1